MKVAETTYISSPTEYIETHGIEQFTIMILQHFGNDVDARGKFLPNRVHSLELRKKIYQEILNQKIKDSTSVNLEDEFFLDVKTKPHANFHCADLRGTNFIGGCSLEKINLQHAFLKGADFAGNENEKINMRGANLQHADFGSGAIFEHVDLTGANLRYAKGLYGNIFSDTILKDIKIDVANAKKLLLAKTEHGHLYDNKLSPEQKQDVLASLTEQQLENLLKNVERRDVEHLIEHMDEETLVRAGKAIDATIAFAETTQNKMRRALKNEEEKQRKQFEKGQEATRKEHDVIQSTQRSG